MLSFDCCLLYFTRLVETIGCLKSFEKSSWQVPVVQICVNLFVSGVCRHKETLLSIFKILILKINLKI
jgi:hypothetical protein